MDEENLNIFKSFLVSLNQDRKRAEAQDRIDPHYLEAEILYWYCANLTDDAIALKFGTERVKSTVYNLRRELVRLASRYPYEIDISQANENNRNIIVVLIEEARGNPPEFEPWPPPEFSAPQSSSEQEEHNDEEVIPGVAPLSVASETQETLVSDEEPTTEDEGDIEEEAASDASIEEEGEADDGGEQRPSRIRLVFFGLLVIAVILFILWLLRLPILESMRNFGSGEQPVATSEGQPVLESPIAEVMPTVNIQATVDASIQLTLDAMPTEVVAPTNVLEPTLDATNQAQIIETEVAAGIQAILEQTPDTPIPTDTPKPTNTPTTTPIPTPESLFEDDFTGGKSDLWIEEFGEALWVDDTITFAEETLIIVNGSENWTDFVVRFDISNISCQGNVRSNGATAAFRLQDINNFVGLKIFEDADCYGSWNLVEGDETKKRPNSEFELPPKDGDIIPFEITIEGDKFSVKNGSTVIVDEFPTGRFGIFADPSVILDNIQVIEIYTANSE